MHQCDVQIGGIYLTHVSGSSVAVLVTATDDRGPRRRYRLERVDTRARLPKPRSAAALHIDARRWRLLSGELLRTVRAVNGYTAYAAQGHETAVPGAVSHREAAMVGGQMICAQLAFGT